MQIYKYCHCLLFVTPEGKPVTEYLPIDHDGRKTYGVVRDPTPKPRTPPPGHGGKNEKKNGDLT